MMTYRELESLADLAQGKEVLEIGSHLGLSTVAIGSTCEHVVSVDWHRGDTQTVGWGFTLGGNVRNLTRYGVLDKVAVVCADSYQLGPLLADESFDVVFIDADHRYQQVKRNVELYLPKLKPGGALCFHDYGCEEPPCFEKQVVDELFGGPDELVDSFAVVWR